MEGSKFEELAVEDTSSPKISMEKDRWYGNYIIIMRNDNGSPKLLLGPHCTLLLILRVRLPHFVPGMLLFAWSHVG